MYDILITVAKKDFIKFKFTYDSIIQNLDGFDKIYCVSNVKMPENLLISDVQYFLDKDIIDFDFSRFEGNIKVREGWYKQQFIKLFQNITSDDYLVVDSDVYFNKKIDIIENGKPSFLFGKDQHHLPYFRFMKMILNLDKVYPHSFINETMFFKRIIINHILSFIKSNAHGFFELAVDALNEINDKSGFSEYELYGNYVTKYFKDCYNYIYLKANSRMRYRIWEKKEIQNYINFIKKSDYDMAAFHSWM